MQTRVRIIRIVGFRTHRHYTRRSFSDRKGNRIHSSLLHGEIICRLVCLPFKDTTRPSVNYHNAKGQLNSLIQKVSHDANLGKQYDNILNSYVEKEFIEEFPNDPIAGHYMPHHPVFKKSTTTPMRIVFNASSKPTDGTSLNDCLFTGPSLTAKLHDILLTFHQGQCTITADISKAFHRILVNEQGRDYLKFLWFNLETEEQRMFRFRVVMFGATCSPYLLQETLQTHLSENCGRSRIP